MRYFRFAVVFVCLAARLHAQQQVPAEQRAMCADIESAINAQAKFTQTSCRVGGGNTKDSISLLVISIIEIWDDEEAKQMWFESIVQNVGTTLNASANANLKVDEIIVADTAQLEKRVVYALPAPFVKDTQAKLKAGTVKLTDVYPLVQKALITKPITVR